MKGRRDGRKERGREGRKDRISEGKKMFGKVTRKEWRERETFGGKERREKMEIGEKGET